MISDVTIVEAFVFNVSIKVNCGLDVDVFIIT